MAVDMELEKVLRPYQYEMPPYPPKVITLANGKKMVVRQAEREDVPEILKSVHPCLFIERDYYDIVSARLYGELLAWYRHRVKSEYCLMGQVDGYLVGVVNGRMENEKVGMSYHTLAIDRGLRIGSHLFAAKMEYHMEYLQPGRGADRGREPDRVPALDDRVPAGGNQDPARAGRRQFLGADPGDLFQSQAAPGGWRAPGAAGLGKKQRGRSSSRMTTRSASASPD